MFIYADLFVQVCRYMYLAGLLMKAYYVGRTLERKSSTSSYSGPPWRWVGEG